MIFYEMKFENHKKFRKARRWYLKTKSNDFYDRWILKEEEKPKAI